MPFRIVLLVATILVASWPCLAQDPIHEFYQRGAAAAQEGDDALHLAAMDEARRLAPGNPILLRHCAQALTRLGRRDAALARLREITALGASFDFAAYEDLAPLLTEAGWPAFEAEHLASRGPAGSMELAFTLSEDDLVPDGIAYDGRSDAFFLSSTAKRKIVRAARDGSCSDFIASGQHGYLCGLGLALDASRRWLWAISDAPTNAGLFDEITVRHSAVHVFDLDDRRLLFSYDFPPDEDLRGRALLLHRQQPGRALLFPRGQGSDDRLWGGPNLLDPIGTGALKGFSVEKGQGTAVVMPEKAL
jgi:hypothetical protein